MSVKMVKIIGGKEMVLRVVSARGVMLAIPPTRGDCDRYSNERDRALSGFNLHRTPAQYENDLKMRKLTQQERVRLAANYRRRWRARNRLAQDWPHCGCMEFLEGDGTFVGCTGWKEGKETALLYGATQYKVVEFPYNPDGVKSELVQIKLESEVTHVR